MFKRLDPYGNPNVGVYVRVTSSHLLHPPGLTEQNVSDLEEAFGLEGIELTIGGATLVGSLMAANRHGAVLADSASNAEMQILRDAGLNVTRLQSSRLNATGNNILCNDQGGICNPAMTKGQQRAAAEVLDIELVPGTIADIPTVGTAAVAINTGVLCHPLTTEDELSFIKQCLHAPARIGTVNHGHGLVGAGMAANAAGVACGSRTTGIELGRIEEALGLE